MSEPYEPRRRPVTVIVPAGAFDPNGVMPRCTTCGGFSDACWICHVPTTYPTPGEHS
jgi:hypothetical protein